MSGSAGSSPTRTAIRSPSSTGALHPAAGLHDAASELDAPLPELPVSRPVEVVGEIAAACLHLPVPVPEGRRPADNLSGPALLDVRPDPFKPRVPLLPGRQERLHGVGRVFKNWNMPGTKGTFPPPKGPSQVPRIHSAPPVATTGPAIRFPDFRAGMAVRKKNWRGMILIWRGLGVHIDRAWA